MKDYWSDFWSAFIYGAVVVYIGRVIANWLSNRRK